VVVTYSGTDPLELSGDALLVLQRFDGRPTGEVLRQLAEEDGLDVELDLVRRMHDFLLLEGTRDAT
jgi:hypothetical protein